jgi:hypothetical protein
LQHHLPTLDTFGQSLAASAFFIAWSTSLPAAACIAAVGRSCNGFGNIRRWLTSRLTISARLVLHPATPHASIFFW